MSKTLLEQIKTDETPLSIIDEKYKIEFVYPYGASLNVINPSSILLTTTTVAYPFNRPLAGYYRNENNGKIIAIGSGHMFQDKYLNDESNSLIWDYFLHILVTDNFKFDRLDFTDVEVSFFYYFNRKIG